MWNLSTNEKIVLTIVRKKGKSVNGGGKRQRQRQTDRQTL